MLNGTTESGHRYHQTWHNRTHVVAQVNRLGEWHGYVNAIWRLQFNNESEAVQWVRDHETAAGVSLGVLQR